MSLSLGPGLFQGCLCPLGMDGEKQKTTGLEGEYLIQVLHDWQEFKWRRCGSSVSLSSRESKNTVPSGAWGRCNPVGL